MTLNGVVTRSDGEGAVWINGHEAGDKTASGVRATTSANDPTSAQLRIGGARKSMRLRVGQRLDPASGKVLEPYEAAASSAATAVTPPKKLVEEAGPPEAVRPVKTDAADADEPSNE